HAELLRHLAGLAELADDLTAELHFVDVAAVQALRIVGARRVRILRRAARDADRLRRPDVGDLRLERAVSVKDLDPLVAGVGHVDIAGRISRDAADLIELPLTGSRGAPRLDEVAVLGELADALVGAVAVGHVDVARALPRDIRRP